MSLPRLEGRIGLALGSGAARGWAHVGVLHALQAAGIVPEIVCGSSSGALVGALYAAGRLDHLEGWGRQLDFRKVVSYFDFSLRGGLIRARKFIDFLAADLPAVDIEGLAMPFAAVATDLESGREIWLREGSLIEALRASMAIPGLVTPVRIEGRWLVDGGLVNPVPVSLCRAMGADSVIAVDLNTTLLRRRAAEPTPRLPSPEEEPARPPLDPKPEPSPLELTAAPVAEGPATAEASEPPPGVPALLDDASPDENASEQATFWSVSSAIQDFLADLRTRMVSRESAPAAEAPASPPSIFEVMASSINVMSVRITRSRMAGDPPDLLITPRLWDYSLLDFHRAEEAIEEGRRAAEQALSWGSADDTSV